jgi:toxin ParE1/3/4
MASVAWTDQAIEDLAAACAFIARDSERMAQAFAGRFYVAVGRLATFPESGRIVPE